MTIEYCVTATEDSISLKTVQVETCLGPAEISWTGEKLSRFAWLAKRNRSKRSASSNDLTAAQRDLVQDVADYATGIRIDFAEVPTDLAHGTPFSSGSGRPAKEYRMVKS